MPQTLYEWCVQVGDTTLLRQWDAEKNADLTPWTISCSSRRKLHWRCDRGHSWQAFVYVRVAGIGCPYCDGQQIQSADNNLATMFPNLAREWHPERNLTFPPPSEVSPWSRKKVYWICDKGHEWEAVVKSRTNGNGCPICAGRVVLPGFNDLATTHPSLVAEWNVARNARLTACKVVAGSDRRVWWQCKNGHEWRATISSRALGGHGCPYCTEKRRIPGETDFATKYPQIAAEWDQERNGDIPNQLAPQSNRKAWWVCPLGHSYSARVASRVSRGSGCPYCAGRRVLIGFNDLATKEPSIAAQWYQPLNGDLTPEQVTSGSTKKVYWQCSEHHVWRAIISSRAGKQKCGCPVCAGKTKVRFANRYQEITEQEILSDHMPQARKTVVK